MMWSPQQPQPWHALLQQNGAASMNLSSASSASLISGNANNQVPFTMSSHQLPAVSPYSSFNATPQAGSSPAVPTFPSSSIYVSQKASGAIGPSIVAPGATSTGVALMPTQSQPYQVKSGIFPISQSPQSQLSSAGGTFRAGMNLQPQGHGNPMNAPPFLNSQMASPSGFLPNPSMGSVSNYPRLISPFNPPAASAAINPLFYSQQLINPTQTPGNRPTFPHAYMTASNVQSKEGVNMPMQAETMEIFPVAAPQDEELVNTIHRVAEYCANNVEMEEYVRQNNGHQHKFRFLVGGEGSDYFQWILYCHKMGMDLSKQEPLNEENTTATSADSTASESPIMDLESLVIRYQEFPKISPPLSEELQKELEDVLSSLEHQATADGIRTARHWVEVNCNVMETAKQVASAMHRKMENLENFILRLHLLMKL